MQISSKGAVAPGLCWKDPGELYREWNPCGPEFPQLPLVRTILFPFDLSGRALTFVPLVRALADSFDSEVLTMHVDQPDTAGQGRVEAALLRMRLGADRTHYMVRNGCTARAICLTAMEHADLVVLPTRGYGPLWQRVSASVSARVLEDLQRPVLLCPEGSEGQAGRGQGVLCLMQAPGEDRLTVLNWAVALAVATCASLAVFEAGGSARQVAGAVAGLGAELIVTGRSAVAAPYDIARRARCPVLAV